MPEAQTARVAMKVRVNHLSPENEHGVHRFVRLSVRMAP
jgi:hypothetical protein